MTAEAVRPRRFRAAFAAPVVIALMLAMLFGIALYSGDPSRLPSALIGKPAPQFSLPPVEGVMANGKPVPGFSTADLATGEPTIVTVWASWCPPCVAEQPALVGFKAKHDIRLFGINHKDEPANAQRFLTRLGNPFDTIGADRTGRVSIDWGVYGVPETYVVDGDGQIVYKLVGPVSAESLRDKILPAVKGAKGYASKKAGTQATR